MTTFVIIPARLESSRLSKKLIQNIGDKALIEHMIICAKKINNSNPKIIPRNHIIENILDDCSKENYNELNRFISLLNDPYNSDIPDEYMKEPTNEEKVYQTFCGT